MGRLHFFYSYAENTCMNLSFHQEEKSGPIELINPATFIEVPVPSQAS